MANKNADQVTRDPETEHSKKTRMMISFETEHNLKLEKVIPEYYRKYASLEATAGALGVNINTLYGWMLRLGITIRRTVSK